MTSFDGGSPLPSQAAGRAVARVRSGPPANNGLGRSSSQGCAGFLPCLAHLNSAIAVTFTEEDSLSRDDDQIIERNAKRLLWASHALSAAASELRTAEGVELSAIANDATAEAARCDELWRSVERCSA
jgi:hypothetical protein